MKTTHIRPRIRGKEKGIGVLLNTSTELSSTSKKDDQPQQKNDETQTPINVVFFDKNTTVKTQVPQKRRPTMHKKKPTQKINTKELETTHYDNLQLIDDPIERSAILSIYQELIHIDKKGLFFYGGMPINVMSESYIHLIQKIPNTTTFKYAVTPKLDGFRFLVFIHPNVGIVFITREMKLYKPELQVQFNQIQIPFICLLDGEYFLNMFFIFDILYYSENSCSVYTHNNIDCLKANYPFNDRYFFIQNLFTEKSKFLILAKSVYEAFKIEIHYKKYFYYEEVLKFLKQEHINNFYEAVIRLYSFFYNTEKVQLFKYDGLIFIPRFTKYIIGDNWKYPNNILYKWKPFEDLTIDVKFLEHENVIIDGVFLMYACVLTQSGKIYPYTIDKNRKERIKVINSRNIQIRYDRVYEIYCVSYSNVPENLLFDIKQERNISDKSVPNTVKNVKSVLKCITSNMNINYILPFIDTYNIENIEHVYGINERQLLNNIDTHFLQQMFAHEKKAPIILSTDSVIRRFNKQHTHIDELEFRVGIYDNATNKFRSHVSFKHYDWLKKTLETLGYRSTYCETVDFFSSLRPNIRTTYYYNNDQSLFSNTTIQKTIKKIKQDTKTTNDTFSMYGYALRISVSSEKPVYNESPIVYDMSNSTNTTFYRIKKRTTFMYSSSFDIDLTEISSNNDKTRTIYEVEIEYKLNQREQTNRPVSFNELNDVIHFVYSNLYGLSEIL